MEAVRRNAALFRRLAAKTLEPWLAVVGGGGGGEGSDGSTTEEVASLSPVIHLQLKPEPPREKVRGVGCGGLGVEVERGLLPFCSGLCTVQRLSPVPH